MASFTPATALATYLDDEVNRSLEIVGEVKYWHPTKFKHLCRDIHEQNYHLYCALGKHLLRLGLIAHKSEEYTAIDYSKMLLAIIDFLPDDFIPYKLMGATTPARDCEWRSEIKSCSE
jgi:hypothetical protein